MRPSIASLPRSGWIMTDQLHDRVVAHTNRLICRRANTELHRVGDFVDRAAAQRVVRMRLEQCAPRRLDERASRRTDACGERRPRLGLADEQSFGSRVHALLVRTRGEGALERPCVAIGVAKLAAYERQRLTELTRSRDDFTRERAQ